MDKINDIKLNEVSGGLQEKYLTLKNELLAEVPESVKRQLADAKGDVAVCKVLADNGIDLAAIEKKIENAGFNTKRIGLQLPDDDLKGIAGGFEIEGRQFSCSECGASDRRDFSFQFWESLLTPGVHQMYRCKKCNTYWVCN